jgi:hypothetical protein
MSVTGRTQRPPMRGPAAARTAIAADASANHTHAGSLPHRHRVPVRGESVDQNRVDGTSTAAPPRLIR